MADPQQQKRRLKLAHRQFALAQIARREAMAALADAIDEETRSTALAQRSQKLLNDYDGRAPADDGDGLRDNASFVRRLQEVADHADKARKDASDQAAWQVQSLASAQTRADRFEESLERATRAIEASQAKREHSAMQGVARKLQNNPKKPPSEKLQT